MVWSGNIVIEETHKQEVSSSNPSAISEQALIDMLATLSLPAWLAFPQCLLHNLSSSWLNPR